MNVKLIMNADVRKWLSTRWDRSFEWSDQALEGVWENSLTTADVECALSDSLMLGQVDWCGEEIRSVSLCECEGLVLAIIWTIRGKTLKPVSLRRTTDDEKEAWTRHTTAAV